MHRKNPKLKNVLIRNNSYHANFKYKGKRYRKSVGRIEDYSTPEEVNEAVNKYKAEIVELLPNGMDIGILHKVYKVKGHYIKNKPDHIKNLSRRYPDAFNLDEYYERIFYDLEDLFVDRNNTLFNFPGCRSWVRKWDSSTNITTL